MTTAHTVTLLSIVLARLEPYMKRTKPDCTFDIEYKYDSTHGKGIRISTCQWRNDAIIASRFLNYNFDEPGAISINDFIDDVIEQTKPFYN